jgi:hypothetical protein
MQVQGIRELPTSGFVAAGSYVKDYENRTLFLAGLDAGGQVQWLRRYKLDGAGSEAAFPGLALSDDGGAFTATYATVPGDGSLWTMKPFAKDGSITFATGASADTVPNANGTCPLVGTSIVLAAGDLPVQPKPYALTVVDVPTVKAVQAP